MSNIENSMFLRKPITSGIIKPNIIALINESVCNRVLAIHKPTHERVHEAMLKNSNWFACLFISSVFREDRRRKEGS
jgi:hypothetical protein